MDTRNVMDFSQDIAGADRHRLTALYPPPAYVKQASHDDLCGDTENLPQHIFAMPTKRLYRCHTKAATWMSALYFGDKEQEIPEPHRSAARGHILKAAGAFGILGEVSALLQGIAKAAEDVNAATPDEDYALVWEGENGVKERHYPIRNANEAKVAAAFFMQHRDKFTYPERRLIANKILDKADAHGASLLEADELAKAAGWGSCGAVTAAEAWEKRAALTQSSFPQHSKEALAMGAIVRKSPPSSRQPQTLEKMADLLDQFDRTTKLTGLYDNGLERPEDSLFQVTAKAASDFLHAHVQLVTGNVYEKQALADIKLATVREWLGNEVADAVRTPGGAVDVDKMAEVLTVLPRPDATMFDRMAASLRLEPAVIEKAAAASLFTAEDLAGLRQIYMDAKKLLQAS